MLDNLKQKKEQRMQEEMKRKEEEKELIADIAFAQAELNELKKEYGIEDEEKGLKKLISKILDIRDKRGKIPVNRKKYLRLCLLGIFGVHRFYAKQYITGVLYLLLFWSGLSISMTIIDWMIAMPMKADENGNIWL